jgi:hypothetical protein
MLILALAAVVMVAVAPAGSDHESEDPAKR